VKISCFKIAGKIPGGISIARTHPRSFKGPEYKPLFPPADLLGWYKTWLRRDRRFINLTELWGEYCSRYRRDVLNYLDSQSAYEALVLAAKGYEPILLCWEEPEYMDGYMGGWRATCHRSIVAAWFENDLKITIREYPLGPA